MNPPITRLIDRRSIATELPIALAAIAAAPFCGIDCETEDTNRHAGVAAYAGYRDDGTRAKNKKLVFDNRRTTMTGFSLWPEGSPVAWYINLAHADVENRLSWTEVVCLLDALPADASWTAHNAPYELVMFENCVGYRLERMICTLQMAVSAYGPDEYNLDAWRGAGLGAMRGLVAPLMEACRRWAPSDPRSRAYPTDLADLVAKVTSKVSDAGHSYNGFVKELTYGYGLKAAVKTWFGYQMTTFEQVLGDKKHMGELTGDEACAYGAEDAYWCLRLFRTLLDYMVTNCPKAITAFFEQENPMIYVYAEIWRDGIRINLGAVEARRTSERLEFVSLVTQLKALVRKTPWRDELDPELADEEKWYASNGRRYRNDLSEWAWSDDDADPFTEATKIAGAVPNAWADELGIPVPKRLNLGHYMPMRVIYYDLLDCRIIKSAGKVQSDGDCRAKLIIRLEKEGGREDAIEILKLMGLITSVEQRMKLYLTPYMLLTDPETSRIYPVVTSMLASRRMAASVPNTMALAKAGESTYVRGFYLGDQSAAIHSANDSDVDMSDHLILSLDWSGIELVRIGEESRDPEFIKAYGQLPHADLHSGAAADLLRIEIPEMTEEMFKSFRNAKTPDDIPFGRERLLVDLDGRNLDASKVYSYWRRELGKVANFNYWYSGWLSSIAERMGWTMDQTAEAVGNYASRFAVAEEWRRDVIAQGAFEGYTMICDGHRRVRPEARFRFMDEWMAKWPHPSDSQVFTNVVRGMGSAINRRAGNQLVNSRIQGGCAAVAKRSILRVREAFKREGIDRRVARFMWPTHDELTFSTRWDMSVDIMNLVKPIMCEHPDLFQHVKLDASASLGVTFEPWNHKSARTGQVELFEAPAIPPVPVNCIGGPLTTESMKGVAEWLHTEGRLAA
jgi:DNA polymerase I-like protein with 3'-5' exonuclease and polymerase domains